MSTKSIPTVFKDTPSTSTRLAIRVATMVVVLGVLIGIGLGLMYTEGLPASETFSNLAFDWKVDPKSYLLPFNQSFEYNVLLDGHSHSTYSDGKMNIRQLLDWHIANGYNAVIVSDHNTVEGGLAAEKLALAEYNETIVVIPAMEYSCCRIHMNFIDINQTIPEGPPVPTDEELRQVIDQVHSLGGLVIVNHIPWSNTTEDYYQDARLPNHPSVNDLISWGVDGFEIVHQDVLDYPTLQVTQTHNLVQMTGTDVHHPSVGANVWLTVNVTKMDRQSIMQEIRNRHTSFLLDPAGTRQRSYSDSQPRSYNRLLPLTALGGYFSMFYTDYKGMYSFHGTFCHPERLIVHGDLVGWFIFWVLVGLLMFEIVRGLCLFLMDFIHRKRHINHQDYRQEIF
ncbi:polymerase/histidinol phosphatase-like protein [Phycomyces blakesleeanus]|uniref:Polymerase/histidinol phosphatase-like protein n=1 Tax=Phycomyces blakesleeanus TaxID=4837 RepID=A0ABR3B6A3_PHYBL